MFVRNIYDHYRLYCNEIFNIGKYEAFEADGQFYITVPADLETAEELEQSLAVGDYLQSYGESGIVSLVKTVNGETTALVDGHSVYVFKCPIDNLPEMKSKSTAEKLAVIHQKGSYFQLQGSPYYGQWKFFWQKRLDQLEQWYQYILQQPQKTEVDEVFILTYPYYMGLTENAIQYLVDTDLDVGEWENPTVCHRCFNETTWLQITNDYNQQVELKLPTEWVIDHPARDIAEWIRSQRFSENADYHIQKFLLDYEQVRPLSAYSWRLLYGRLLFPLDYFEAIEGYYQKRMDEHFLFNVLEQEAANQAFLFKFFERSHSQNNSSMLPMVDWLR